MPRGYFIAGTDTEVGKTFIGCALLEAWNAHGLRTAALKPVACGCERTPAGLHNADALALQAHAGLALPYPEINPYAFEPPVSPHLAAAEAGDAIDIERIMRHYRDIAGQADLVLVEGAGGWFAPIDGQRTMADIAIALDLPVILVVGMRLGCLNHALLTAQAIQHSGLKIAGWVANTLHPQMERLDDNVQTLAARFAFPCLGHTPYTPGASPAQLAHLLDIDALA